MYGTTKMITYLELCFCLSKLFISTLMYEPPWSNFIHQPEIHVLAYQLLIFHNTRGRIIFIFVRVFVMCEFTF